MKTVIKHVLIWLGVYVMYTYMLSYYGDLRAHALVNVVNVSLFIIAYYLLRYVQIPFLYDKGRKVLFVLSLIMSSFALASICRLNGIWWMDAMFGKNSDGIPFLTPGSYLIKCVRFYTPAIAFLAWEAYQTREQELGRMRELEKEKISNELKFLKAQVNPHFLFNTLNNLYSLVVAQSPGAPDMILQLSGILDYVLYKSQKEKVSLSEEVEAIKDFVKLEQIRYGDRLKVGLMTEGDMSTQVSPLLLLSIVENAFKHGASGDVQYPRIDIRIVEKEGEVECFVWNTKSSLKGELNDAYREGIGLSNLKRQLDLVYPDRHELKIDDLAEEFSIDLHLTAKAS